MEKNIFCEHAREVWSLLNNEKKIPPKEIRILKHHIEFIYATNIHNIILIVYPSQQRKTIEGCDFHILSSGEEKEALSLFAYEIRDPHKIVASRIYAWKELEDCMEDLCAFF